MCEKISDGEKAGRRRHKAHKAEKVESRAKNFFNFFYNFRENRVWVKEKKELSKASQAGHKEEQ